MFLLVCILYALHDKAYSAEQGRLNNNGDIENNLLLI
ncbi:hypothetical protein BMETH_462_1 [methanotrophic bacterial endosymbiont of Bathymodiolus sp.]|nr:hypothetical protein BMETH_462_1 [methanotrophic bacterial endosymbiont of Bathymodiolus sp.]